MVNARWADPTETPSGTHSWPATCYFAQMLSFLSLPDTLPNQIKQVFGCYWQGPGRWQKGPEAPQDGSVILCFLSANPLTAIYNPG